MNLNETLELTRTTASEYRMIVLTEGISDMLAIKTLAQRLGIDLDAKRIAVVAMGGATNIGHFVDLLKPYQQKISVAGLYDIGEEHHFLHALEQAEFGSDLTRSELETLGFYVCDPDLEDELIRAVGVDAILEVASTQGDLRAFRTFQRQPEWRERGGQAQLRRWIGSGATRKIRYAKLLVNALDLGRIPAPLNGLLTLISRIK